MRQDFIAWLKGGNDEKISDGGFLIAPVDSVTLPEPEADINLTANEEKNEENNYSFDDVNFENEITIENQNGGPDIKDLSSEILELHNTVQQLQNSIELQTDAAEPQIKDTPLEINPDDENIREAWQERAADLDLSLDEPPPELWTRIGESDDDDEDIEYEQGMSLQGAAYIQKRERGKNFTERLQHSMKIRKQKAEAVHEQEEEEKKSRHPYFSHAVIICFTMLMILGAVCLALWFVMQLTPEGLYENAMRKFQAGDYEGAMNLFQRGYKSYPNVLSFLTGIEKCNEALGITSADLEVETEELKPVSEDLSPDVITEKETESVDVDIKIPVTFEDFLNEGNNAYNLGMYNAATLHFHRAMELNKSDIRPYIGLGAAYRQKAMYFDSKRILDEAKKKFKRNPTVEVGLKFLEED